MSDLHDRNSKRGLWGFYARHRNSDATLGVALALIAMLFIVTAFIHAADTSKVQSAQAPATPPAAETTGSGSAGP